MKISFLEFCRRNYYRAFVCMGIGMSIEFFSHCTPSAFEFWLSFLGILIAVASAVVCGIGLILERRHHKQDKK
ncbi:MAG TPA: hypothetical protein VHG71_07745 [Verrucomicrobiae bacterium]|nr:hypothetical protein [Verrucomicrobiae bacterium]